ncbi:MAG: hypothetical protein R3D00_12140 [Bacteroidia bacterium]
MYKQLLLQSALFTYLCLMGVEILHAQMKGKSAIGVDIGWYPGLNPLTGILYERQLGYADRQGLSFRFRTGIYLGLEELGYDNAKIGIPTVVTLLTGRNFHHFESSLGVIWTPGNRNEYLPPLFPVAEIGYRYMPPNGGFVLRTRVGTTGLGGGIGWAF